jgi:hypothetical protein
MKRFTRIGILAGLIALAFLINPTVTRAQNYRKCAWPIEWSPEGFGNVIAPDNTARYWAMPFDDYETMTIKGTYPNARYFSIAAYATNPDRTVLDLANAIHDADIAPDPGSINPFVEPGGRNGTYTVVISRTGTSSGNIIAVPSDFAWVVLRIYVPDADSSLSGKGLRGGVPLPTISVTANGATQQLDPCSPVNKLPDVGAVLQLLFSGNDVNGNEGTPSSDRLWFAPPEKPPVVLLPNPDNKYIMMLPGDTYQPGRIIVIHGKAPGFPDTFDGSPIWVPSRGFQKVDMRYWSICNNDFALPVPVVNCATDLTTDLQGGYYTIVISDDLLRPNWLKPNVNWLPWGDEQYPKLIFLRNMLSAPDFQHAVQNAITAGCAFKLNFPNIPDRSVVDEEGPCTQGVMADYYPVAAWCDKSTFIHGGWGACLKGTGRR